jgi:hypothetical protein
LLGCEINLIKFQAFKGDSSFFKSLDVVDFDFFKCGINFLELEFDLYFIQVLTNTYNNKTKHHSKLKAL